MELYRVLLVDDEENIREGISRKIDWQGLGFSLAGEASNGRDALELAEEILPDVVLTDIKMPFMDGLELCGSLTELLPVSKFVIFPALTILSMPSRPFGGMYRSTFSSPSMPMSCPPYCGG